MDQASILTAVEAPRLQSESQIRQRTELAEHSVAPRWAIRQYRTMPDSPPPSLAHTFEALPLSRGRAYLSLTFGGLALLLVGGVLSYASGSPDVHGTVSTYWTVFFTFHALAFGGAALLGAFPRLARWPIKIGWLVLVAVALAAALAIRAAALEHAGAAVPASTAVGPYAIALLPVVVGLLWGGEGFAPPSAVAGDVSHS